MKRSNYTLEELIGDDSFRRWVDGNAGPKEEKKWNHWIASSEVNRKLASQATQILVGFNLQSPQMPDVDDEWNRVKKRMEDIDRKKLPTDPRHGTHYSWLYAVAAVILLALLAGISFYSGLWNGGTATDQVAVVKEKTITTGPDEQKTITLSDGSTIVLKSSASLTYYDGWISGKSVRIRLNGQAYFNIEHKTASTRPELQVITPEGIVHDMGTRFIVATKPNRTTIVLEEGKVSVEPRHQDQGTRINVVPGELVEVNNKGHITKRTVNPTLYTSWATGVFKFDYTPISSFAARIEEMYNINVVISPELESKRLNGAVYYRNISDLVKSVSQVLKVPVYRSATGDTIYIGQQTNTSNN